MKLVLVTGMSGAGKSVALKTLEDSGFEAIDNIPLSLLPALASSDIGTRHLAVGTDIRSRDFSVDHFLKVAGMLRQNRQLDFSILFLDCDDEVLRRRFTETRRRHPLALDRTVMDGIQHEREMIARLRQYADLVLDTSELPTAELRSLVSGHFAGGERQLSVVVTSFSFKRGVPREADMVFDVRFLKNPYYDEALRPKSGLDEAVGRMIESDSDFAAFYDRLKGFVAPLLPRYQGEGKSYLTVAIGCTGGQHRSVFVAQKLGGFLGGEGYNVTIRHRDLE
jgi:UPF0042 nucleotide-binding protein